VPAHPRLCIAWKRVAALIRPASASKPEVTTLREQGVDIRLADLESPDAAQLRSVLEGIDILLSAIDSRVLDQQKPLFSAAKEAGVKRIIPCDFGRLLFHLSFPPVERIPQAHIVLRGFGGCKIA
jgi:hypothetical protein